MGQSYAENGEFIMPYGETFLREEFGPQYSHHYPPMYPLYLSMFYSLFGLSVEITKIASFIISIGFIAVLFLATRDLFGSRKALIVTAILSVEPVFVVSAAHNYSENLVGIFFVITMWAILKSLQNDKWIVVAGAAAALGYLTKSSMGYFFLIAGIGGLLWRFYYLKWAVFKNKYYITAITLFGSIILIWSIRNVMLFGWPNWETSGYVAHVIGYAVSHPLLLAIALVVKIPLFTFFFIVYFAFFQKEVTTSIKYRKNQFESCLFLSIGLVFFLSWLLASMFWVYEQSGLFWMDNYRYIVFGFIPLLWLAVKHLDTPPISFSYAGVKGKVLNSLSVGYVPLRYRVGAIISILIISNIVYSVQTPSSSEIAIANALNQYAVKGDTIAVDEVEVYYFYPYLDRDRNITITAYSENTTATFIVSGNSTKVYRNYSVFKIYLNGKEFGSLSEIENLPGGTLPETKPYPAPTLLISGDPPQNGLTRQLILLWLRADAGNRASRPTI